MTWADLILQTLRRAGVVGQGQTPSAEDTTGCVTELQNMLAEWRRQRWLVTNLITTSLVSTGATSYTIGTGGDFNVARPDRIEYAFARQLTSNAPGQVDYTLILISAREDYDRIALKSMTGFPAYLFYDSAYPLGNLFVWPIPQASTYGIYLTIKSDLTSVTGSTIAQEIALPAEYVSAIMWNLAARIRPQYQMAPDPSVTALAKNALNVVRGANAQIPDLVMPGALRSGSQYNVFSDTLGQGN
jgi:hypothetical protein